MPAARPDWCLFLDFDGTLVELRDHPSQVVVSRRLMSPLDDLLRTFDGAVAIAPFARPSLLGFFRTARLESAVLVNPYDVDGMGCARTGALHATRRAADRL